jgi:hypothetical protein
MTKILCLIFGLSLLAASCTTWTPKIGETWQYQLQGQIDTTVNAAVFDIDGFDNSASTVTTLHNKGRHVLCYLSAGSWEDWRPDAASFPASVKGQSNGWPGEKWLDIRQVAVLKPIMAARFDMCKAKGFDAVEPDNVDGYTNSTGFPLTAAQQATYNKMLAQLGHDRGLKVGLKNDIDQVGTLVGSFDFAVNEQCFQYKECDTLEPFITAGKPVFNVEYKTTNVCAQAAILRFSSIQKKLSLDAYRISC